MNKLVNFSSIRYGLLTVLFLFPSLAFSQEKNPSTYITPSEYVDSLVNKSKEMNLSEDPYWLLLLHYKTSFHGRRSLIDDPAFFISPDGKRNSQAELEATIRIFFCMPNESEVHQPTRFIARYHWLNQKLNFDKTKLPIDFESQFKQFFDKINPASAILVFPAGYLESPASMFGHTFLLLEDQKGNRLTSIAINYAAKTDESFGPWFSTKGLIGLYYGYYSFLPYYDKINEYSSCEKRDMWEYRLNLNKDELLMMTMHMIEMEKIGGRYFFVDENCSYNLMFLVESARPSTRLTSKFIFTSEPIDTLRAAIKSGLVDKKEYRPSLFSKLMYRKNSLNAGELKAASNIVKNDIDPKNEIASFSENSRAKILDLAADHLQYSLSKNELPLQTYTKKYLAVLRLRSEISAKDILFEKKDQPASPESSHLSKRISLYGGRMESAKFAQLAFRVTCHDIMDIDKGLIKNSQLICANTVARYYVKTKKLRLQNFDVVDIMSLPAINRFSVDRCFSVKAGAAQMVDPSFSEHLTGYFNLSFGLSAAFPLIGQIYSLGGFELNMRDCYSHNFLGKAVITAGLLTDIGERWKSHLIAKGGYIPFGDKSKFYEGIVQQRLSITTNTSVILSAKRTYIFNGHFDEISGSANLHF